jgi:hypothetical protein
VRRLCSPLHSKIRKETSQDIPGRHKATYPKQELIVEEKRRNQLDAKLKEMIKQFDQVEAKRREPTTQCGTGNVIRRREGQKAKRFSV